MTKAFSTVNHPLNIFYEHIQMLLKSDQKIINTWLNHKAVVNIFQHRHIKPEYFNSMFALDIFIDHIDRLEGKERIYHTETMNSFLNFLYHKKLSTVEIIDICTHLRNTFLSFMFENNIGSFELVDELNRVFDTSIKEILNWFQKVYKKNEEKLEREKKCLLEAQRISKIGHWELDIRNNLLFWSDEVYRIFGLKKHTFTATYEAFLERIHPDDVQMVNTVYNKSVKEKSSYHLVYRILTLDNELKHVEARATHHTDKNGNVYRSVGTVHDITDKIILQKELQLASQLFLHSNDSVLITDENNEIIIANQTFSKQTGYSIDEIKGKNPRMFSAGWGDDEFYDQMWSDIITKGIWNGEVWDRKKTGESYIAKITILNIKDDIGNTINYIAISNDITEEKEQQKQITQLAYYDTLTKLPNRVLFRKEIDNFIQSSQSKDQKFAVFFMDLDDFKWINDSMGHKIGNQALVEVARRIRYILNENTVLCRIGGDEFALFYPYDNRVEINALASKIIESIKAPIPMENRDVSLGISIGISLFSENGNDYGSLMQAADTALYQAKENGKNHFVYFDQSMNDNVVRQLDIDSQLHLALSNDSFKMVYQPKISLQTKEVYGLEALIRWQDPKLGFVPPDIFIPIAEKNKIIEDIGYWVIQRSLEDFKQILSKSKNDLVVSINVSGKQFNDKNFIHKVSELISASDVQPKNIEFEITETAIMDNIDIIVQTLNDIKALGVSISIDDFGTGYSSMSYLKKLPINTIKIDRAFIKDIHVDADDKAITEAIVSMSKQLNLTTIAEGIETLEHEEILLSIGVNSAQGYLYSKPISKDEFIEFIE